MKIGFVGHSHHQVTRSSNFFLEVLQRIGTVHCLWDDTWRGEKATDPSPLIADADLVVVWQSVRYAQLLARRGHRNVVYVPMYDAAKALRRSFWSALKDIKVLNFSSALHQRVQSLGAAQSAYFQYFPDPAAHTPVTDFTTLRAFFWQRQQRPSWDDVRGLMPPGCFTSVHLHQAVDPGVPLPQPPSASDREAFTLEVTQWLPERSDLLRRLASSNVYFAPRLDEGIGLAFLEAMAMGMAVCAHDRPTHNEYIVDGVNGFLYRLGETRHPDWSRAESIGRRARTMVAEGYARWQLDQARLVDFLTDPQPSRRALHYAHRDTATELPADADERPVLPLLTGTSGRREGGRRIAGTTAAEPAPLVTIATVVRNAPDELASTLDSVLAQRYPAREVIVIDGASDAATLRVIERYEHRVDYWLSEPDRGPYDAMNKAADLAHGRWVLYINAGDSLADSDALGRLLAHAPTDADFIAAHHSYIAPDGTEEIHRCRAFEHTYRQLLDGATDGAWLGGIPGHQSLLTRTELIRQHRYDLAFRIAADHDFLFRMAQRGATVWVEPVILSQYVGGGLSWQHLFECLAEWRRIALRYTEHPDRVERRFRTLNAHMVRHLRRMGPFDWRREPARSHPWLALAAEAEFRARSLVDRADALYAGLRAR